MEEREGNVWIHMHVIWAYLIASASPQNALQLQYFQEIWREFPHSITTKQQGFYLEKDHILLWRSEQKCFRISLAKNEFVIPNQFDFLLYMEDKRQYLAKRTSFLYFTYNEKKNYNKVVQQFSFRNYLKKKNGKKLVELNGKTERERDFKPQKVRL